MRNAVILWQAVVLLRERVPDMNLSHLEVFLAVAVSSEPLHAQELATRTGLAPPTITRIQKDLMTADLIEVFVDPSNMRYRRTRLRPVGAALLDQVEALGQPRVAA